MKYISVFSGIGGLEHPDIAPEVLCEKDEAARAVLSCWYPETRLAEDIRELVPEPVDVVAGGWPCQDLTVAGHMRGLKAKRSGLFFEMVDFASRCRATTIVAENVPNLLRIRSGRDFRMALSAFRENGFDWVSWRTLDAREFGLPQARRRVIIVASKERAVAMALHRPISDDDLVFVPTQPPHIVNGTYGFYWTGGLGRSLCLKEGVVPALKVGSSTSKGTSPVAVLHEHSVRKLSAEEGLRLQGFFRHEPFEGHIEGDVFRMAGNAVPRPMGAFALRTATDPGLVDIATRMVDEIPYAGFVDEDRQMHEVVHTAVHRHADLRGFLDREFRKLSPQASAGLLTRVIRAKRRIPVPLFDALYEESRTRTRLIGTKINSFEVLDEDLDAHAYRAWLEGGDEPGDFWRAGCRGD